MMVRMVNKAGHAARRSEILAAAQRFVFTKGYESMSIQDILGHLQISKGAFYHYFGSKGALLEALIERILDEVEQLLVPVVRDPSLPALEKLQSFFDTSARWKAARKEYVLGLMRVWYNDENALVRQKVFATMVKRFGPLLAEILRQGTAEGVFAAGHPDQVAGVVFQLFQGLGDTFVETLLENQAEQADLSAVEKTVAAYSAALERVLGAPAGSIPLIDSETLQFWYSGSPVGEKPGRAQ